MQTTIQKTGKRTKTSKTWNDLKFQGLAIKALHEAGETFLVGLLKQANLCVYTCEVCYSHAKGHAVS